MTEFNSDSGLRSTLFVMDACDKFVKVRDAALADVRYDSDLVGSTRLEDDCRDIFTLRGSGHTPSLSCLATASFESQIPGTNEGSQSAAFRTASFASSTRCGTAGGETTTTPSRTVTHNEGRSSDSG